MKFRVRAQWTGPDGRQVGVASEDVEADSACEVLDVALPGFHDGAFTGATITIVPVPEAETDLAL